MGTVKGSLLVATFGAAAIGLGLNVERVRPSAAKGHVLYVPDGAYLTYASVGFRSLLADALYLWSIQYASDKSVKGQEHYLPRVFDVITDLDPRFDEAYFVGAFILATDAGTTEASLRLLDKGFAARRSYLYPYDAGFYCFMYGRDYARARAYFEKAAAQQGCPIYVRRLALGMARLVDPRDAYRLYRGQLASFERENTHAEIAADPKMLHHQRLLRHSLADIEIKLETEALSAIWRVVQARTGRGPETLADLERDATTLSLAPEPIERGNDPWRDPYGRGYAIRGYKVVAETSLRERAGS